jgi:hypothetical protein
VKWSIGKKTWCCEHEGWGCPTTTALPSATTVPSFNCTQGHANPAVGWSDAQKAWCCWQGLAPCPAALAFAVAHAAAVSSPSPDPSPRAGQATAAISVPAAANEERTEAVIRKFDQVRRPEAENSLQTSMTSTVVVFLLSSLLLCLLGAAFCRGAPGSRSSCTRSEEVSNCMREAAPLGGSLGGSNQRLLLLADGEPETSLLE